MATETVNKGEQVYDQGMKDWVRKEQRALALLSASGQLSFGKSVDLVLFRNPITDRSVSEVLNLHAYAADFVNKPIRIEDTAAIAESLAEMDLKPAKIDVGKLAYEWMEEKEGYAGIKEFLGTKLASFLGGGMNGLEPRDVILYGFGRIGRLCARELIRQAGAGNQLRLRAIVTRSNSEDQIHKRASLLRNDSVHGPFPGTVEVDPEQMVLTINGQRVQMIEAQDPGNVDYTQYGIDNALVIDNTGVFRERETLGKHCQAKGVSHVLLTAPGKGDLPNLVFGVNHLDVDKEERIYTAASCTTNAIVPPIKVMRDEFGVEKGHIETIHAYTNDQNLLDNMHNKERRGRSAAINMVITETGAGKAVAKALPEMKGRFTANAVRVPTADGSLAVLKLTTERPTTVEEVNSVFKNAALEGDLVEQIQYSVEPELVSSDIVGSFTPAVFDSNATMVSEDGRDVILYVWYDNEYGYTSQLMKLAKHMAGVRRETYY